MEKFFFSLLNENFIEIKLKSLNHDFIQFHFSSLRKKNWKTNRNCGGKLLGDEKQTTVINLYNLILCDFIRGEIKCFWM